MEKKKNMKDIHEKQFADKLFERLDSLIVAISVLNV